MAAQEVDHHCRFGALLSDHDVHAFHVLSSLRHDGVQGERGLAGAGIADDELTLAAADRNQSVHDLDAGVERTIQEIARYDCRRRRLQCAEPVRLWRRKAIKRLAQWIDDCLLYT